MSDSFRPRVDCSPSGSSIRGILQARILEWTAISFSRGSYRPRDRTQVSRIAGRCFNLWATSQKYYLLLIFICILQFFFFLTLCLWACGILVLRPGMEPQPPAVHMQSHNHWTTREFPYNFISQHSMTLMAFGKEHCSMLLLLFFSTFSDSILIVFMSNIP